MVFKLKPDERPTVPELMDYLAVNWSLDRVVTPVEPAAAPLPAAPYRTGGSDGQSSTPATTPPAPLSSPMPVQRRSSGGAIAALAVPAAPAAPAHVRTPSGGMPVAAAAAPAPKPSADLFDLLSFDGAAPTPAPAPAPAPTPAPTSVAAPVARPGMPAAAARPTPGAAVPAAKPAAVPAKPSPAAPSAPGGLDASTLAGLYAPAPPAGMYGAGGFGPAAPMGGPMPPTAQMGGMRIGWGAAVQQHGGFTPNYDALDDRPRPTGAVQMPPGYGMTPGYGYPQQPAGWGMPPQPQQPPRR
jgi:hypothetical protein